jgi:hypothetical protein
MVETQEIDSTKLHLASLKGIPRSQGLVNLVLFFSLLNGYIWYTQ